ncbi:MAG TPA: hypothetical protein VFV66_26250 [Nonomuraea sp.]|nr:hypothetical protein [Nonomuraea sp.]
MGARRFNTEWLDAEAKTALPILETSINDGGLAGRVATAAAHMGATYGWIAEIEQGRVVKSVLRVEMLPAALIAALPRRANALLALPDLSNAILFTDNGYSLLAGNPKFVRACLNVGIDEARARFFRYAHRVAGSYPGIVDLANEHAPRWRSWRSPREVHPESNTAQQLDLMESLVHGRMATRQFVIEWLSARRRALEDGERLQARFDDLMNGVFYAIDDYALDPELCDEGDISDEELRDCVARTWQQLKSLI